MSNQLPIDRTFDVLVIGGGPAGSSAAAALARHGRTVCLLERTTSFERYRVGESIIPYTYKLLDRLGCLEKVSRHGFQKKDGFNFISSSGRLTDPYFFSQAIDDPKAITWSVERGDFDQLLLDHAAESGVEVHRGISVRGFRRAGGSMSQLRVEGPDGTERTLSARIVIDASGRAGLLPRKLGLRKRDPKLDQMAIWRYLKGGFRQPGRAEGNIVIALLKPMGWFWWIPMAEGITSVGVVASASYLRTVGTDARAIFANTLRSNPTLAEWVEGGTWVSDHHQTGDYSYSASQVAGDGWVAVGDAAAFIDPVFSSGVWMAISSGVLAADHTDAALAAGDPSREAFATYERLFRRAEGTFRVFLDAFYDEHFSAGQFFRRHPEWVSEWGRVLQGDVWGDNRAFNDLLIAYRREVAEAQGVECDIYQPEEWLADHLAPAGERPPDPFRLGSKAGAAAPAPVRSSTARGSRSLGRAKA